MAWRIGTSARNAACDAIVDLVDAGGAGSIEIRTGTQPTDPQTTATGTLLATVTLSATAFGSSSSGVATLAGVPLSATGAAAGTAGWFRMKSGAGTAIIDGSVGTSSADMIVNTTTISVGVTFQITALTNTVPTG